MHTLLALASPRPTPDPTHAVLGAPPWSGWGKVPGVHVEPDRLTVTGINRRVWPEPTQTHDSVSVPGVNNEVILEFTGDFEIKYKVKLNTGSDLYLYLWGYVPMVQDEWRAQNNLISLECQRWGEWGGNNGTVYWSAYDMYEVNTWGSGDVPMGLEADEIEITVRREGGIVTATGNGAPLMSVVDEFNMFPNNEVYLGIFEGRVGESSYVTEITASAVGAGSTVKRKLAGARYVHKTDTSLRRYARENHPSLRIGTSVTAHPLALDRTYGNVLGREFSEVTAEHSMKMYFVQPQQGVFDFSEADMIVEFAVANGMAVHGHCLVWDSALPGWLTEGTWSASQLEAIMVGHITALVGRYRGIIRSWDVINEPFEGFTATLRDNIWHRAMGPGYIEIALRAAHAADPAAKLFINEWGVEDPGTKSQALQALFAGLLADGVPVHGIGFQMHEDVNAAYQETWPDDTPSADRATLSNAVDTYKALGLLFRLSELDVNRHEILPTTEVAMEHYYWDILDVCIEKEAYSFCMWGFTDRWSSLQGWWDYHDYGNGVIFDENYQPKLAYDGLSYRLRDLPSPSPRTDGPPPEVDAPPIHWTVQTTAFGGAWVHGVAYGNGVWVAVGDEGLVATSPDGTSWTTRTTPLGGTFGDLYLYKVTFANGTFVAVGEEGMLGTSSDGINWTVRSSGVGFRGLNSVAYGAGQWVAVGDGGHVTTSLDSVTWTPAGSVLSRAAHDLEFHDGLWVAAQSHRMIETSPNGTVWTEQATPVDVWGQYSVAYGAGVWVATIDGDDPSVVTSPDGITWTQHLIPAVVGVGPVAFARGHFVTSDFVGAVFTSPDGAVWTQRDGPFGGDFVYAFGYGDGQWVAAGEQIATSVPSLT